MATEDEHITGGLTLAISQLSSSVGDLRREAASGFAEIRTALGSKMDKSDGVAITTRLDRMEVEHERTQTKNEERFERIEREGIAAEAARAALKTDRSRRYTRSEKIAAGFGTAYVGGMPFLIFLMTRPGK